MSATVLEYHRVWLNEHDYDVAPDEVFAAAQEPGPQQLRLFAEVNMNSGAKLLRPNTAPTEAEAMSSDLDALRLPGAEPMIRLTPAQLKLIEDERPGHALCCHPQEW